MAFIRICLLASLINCVPLSSLVAQTIFYPENSSQLLRSTVTDIAGLLQRSILDTNTRFTTQSYAHIMPASGIVLVYDSTITDNQLCKLEGTETSLLVFTAAEDNGLIFGVYQYLHELGFRFYQPGDTWEIIPRLSTVFKKGSKSYNTAYKYKSWFISGGHRNWVMDKSTLYNWEVYTGENGHNWSLYQRRNGMMGAHRFAGHRGDILSGNYLATIQNNPCYVANYNGSRQATTSSVPDIYNNEARQLWASTIAQKYTQSKNNILNNPVLYVNQYRSLFYNTRYIGIEVPDGPRWGNSRDSIGCTSIDYASAADQSIVLANSTAQKLKALDPSRRFQVYAYADHADIPSAGITIDPSIDIQVVPTAFQQESSPRGLLNRWYKNYGAVAEYHYLNIPQWSGETPMTYLKELKKTLQRLKETGSKGITWEASPAKFSSLPLLLAANEYLVRGTAADTTLNQFCRDMFGTAAPIVYQLLQEWSSEQAITMGYFSRDNKYKIPRYLRLLSNASDQAASSGGLVSQRLNELKAYLHYMVLYYDWIADSRSTEEKAPKAAALCMYLAKTNKMQLVNSYYLISLVTAKYGSSSPFFKAYNVQTGTAYLDGNVNLITSQEIEANFQDDLDELIDLIPVYKLQTDKEVSAKLSSGNFIPANKINVSLGTTASARFSYSIYAPHAGSFEIKFTVQQGASAKSEVNFTVEDADKTIGIVKDSTFKGLMSGGNFAVSLPAPGFYTLVVCTKKPSSINLEINANGNAFYKNTAFTHRYGEKYLTDPTSLPGFFYVPGGMERVYFSVGNSYTAGRGYLTPAEVKNEFSLKDIYGNIATPVSAEGDDKTLFYINIPGGQSGNFWQVSRMGQYFICFANISNILWYGTKKPCSRTDFIISVVKSGDECITRLSTNSNGNLQWKVEDRGTVLTYPMLREVLLPATVSPAAIITLVLANTCSVTKRISQDATYVTQLESCASGGPLLPVESSGPARLYPNPSLGLFQVELHGSNLLPEIINIYDGSGKKIRIFYNVSAIDLTSSPAGIYYYEIISGSKNWRGKLVKL